MAYTDLDSSEFKSALDDYITQEPDEVEDEEEPNDES